MIERSSIILNIMVQTKKMIAKVRCTVRRVFFLVASFSFSSRLIPSRSMQNEDVSAVSAPSALGKRAEMRPIINRIEMAAGNTPLAAVDAIILGVAGVVVVQALLTFAARRASA